MLDHVITIPVLEAGRTQQQAFKVEATVTTKIILLARHYATVMLHDSAALAYVRFRQSDNEALPYVYFHFAGVEFFATEAGFSTAYRRYLELIDLATAVEKLKSLMSANNAQICTD